MTRMTGRVLKKERRLRPPTPCPRAHRPGVLPGAAWKASPGELRYQGESVRPGEGRGFQGGGGQRVRREKVFPHSPRRQTSSRMAHPDAGIGEGLPEDGHEFPIV